MPKYAVAVLNLFDHENKIHVVEAESDVLAVTAAVLKHSNTELSEWSTEWAGNPNFENVEKAIEFYFDGDICVSEPLKLAERKKKK